MLAGAKRRIGGGQRSKLNYGQRLIALRFLGVNEGVITTLAQEGFWCECGRPASAIAVFLSTTGGGADIVPYRNAMYLCSECVQDVDGEAEVYEIEA